MKFDEYLESIISEEFQYLHEKDEDKEKEDDNKDKKSGDTVCMQTSLFMRILELVREDVDDDEVLHHLAEKIFEISEEKGDDPLSMDDYKEIEKSIEDDDDDDSDDQEDEDLDESMKKPTYVDSSVDQDLSEEKCDGCKESDETVDESDEKNKKKCINESLSARRRKGLVAKLVGKNLSKIRNRKRAHLK